MKRTWLLALLATTPALAQINAGSLAPTADKPFAVTKVAEFNLPWRMAFLPDGRMLITEKGGKVFLATPEGTKTEVSGVPAVQFGGQNGLLGIYAAPTFARDRGIYLTYSEPGTDPATSSLALAHATLETGKGAPSLDKLKVIWRDPIKGKGGQVGATIAFSPDNKLLYLTVGERQRFTPAQDPNQPAGKILRLTLDGKPAPGNPMAGKTGAGSVGVIDPPRNSEGAKTAPVVRTFTFSGPNLTPAETWSSGHRTPYGLAFAPDGKLWEVEHGPRGGDELNLIEAGKNYGWPLAVYGANYDGVPIPSPDTRPDLTKPVIYWNPVIAPGNLMFYSGSQFPQWKGSAFVSGLGSGTLNRIIVDGANARPAERWTMGFRVRDVEQAPDGTLWLLEDSASGGLYRLAPK
ncbi:MAG TPA: PQQ-dependent sugar dehydrogenase [Steroidobacteraceae bacterium]|nr:PQQ-dependent sugar dehydrogenase [Steroidobacteraceae bacterium]